MDPWMSIPRRLGAAQMSRTWKEAENRKPDVVTIRNLLGHRCITSTQVYLHTTAEDLCQVAAVYRKAARADLGTAPRGADPVQVAARGTLRRALSVFSCAKKRDQLG